MTNVIMIYVYVRVGNIYSTKQKQSSMKLSNEELIGSYQKL